MAEPLRVEVPTAALALALIDRLRMFPTELTENGSCEVRVTLVGNPDRAVTPPESATRQAAAAAARARPLGVR